jgi:hypothetical protein
MRGKERLGLVSSCEVLLNKGLLKIGRLREVVRN